MKKLPKNLSVWSTNLRPSLKKTERRLSLKFLVLLPVLAAAVLLSGCASNSNKLVLSPVGPEPVHPVTGKANNGSLVVYSALESYPDLNAENAGWNTEYQEYSDYQIFRTDGKLFKSVSNNEGQALLHPQQVELPVGEYRIVAKAKGFGRITVPVIVASHRITVLHLEGDGFWPREYGFNETNSVHLPNGQIVGWRATTQNAPAS